MRQREKVSVFERRGSLGEKRLKQAVGFSLSKTNSPDTLSEWVPDWHDAHWQRVTKMRDVPCVFWRNFATVGERLCAYQIFLTRSQRPKLDPRAGERIGKHDFYEFCGQVRFFWKCCRCPGASAADSTRLWICGWGKTCISHQSEAAAAAAWPLPPCQQFTLFKHLRRLNSHGEDNDLGHTAKPWPVILSSLCWKLSLCCCCHLVDIQAESCFMTSEDKFVSSRRVVYFPLDCSLSMSLFISFASSEAPRPFVQSISLLIDGIRGLLVLILSI